MSKLWYLENINLFKILCPHKYKAYKNCHNFNYYGKQDYIYFEHDASTKVYLIEKGKIKLGYYTTEGDEIMMNGFNDKDHQIFVQTNQDTIVKFEYKRINGQWMLKIRQNNLDTKTSSISTFFYKEQITKLFGYL